MSSQESVELLVGKIAEHNICGVGKSWLWAAQLALEDRQLTEREFNALWRLGAALHKLPKYLKAAQPDYDEAKVEDTCRAILSSEVSRFFDHKADAMIGLLQRAMFPHLSEEVAESFRLAGYLDDLDWSEYSQIGLGEKGFNPCFVLHIVLLALLDGHQRKALSLQARYNVYRGLRAAGALCTQRFYLGYVRQRNWPENWDGTVLMESCPEIFVRTLASHASALGIPKAEFLKIENDKTFRSALPALLMHCEHEAHGAYNSDRTTACALEEQCPDMTRALHEVFFKPVSEVALRDDFWD